MEQLFPPDAREPLVLFFPGFSVSKRFFIADIETTFAAPESSLSSLLGPYTLS